MAKQEEVKQKSLEEIEVDINDLKSRKAQINSAMKICREEILRRQKMEMDTKEFDDQFKRLDKELLELVKLIPEKETEYYDLRRKQDKEFKTKQLKEYCELRLRYYRNVLDKINGKKGKQVIPIRSNRFFEAAIGQFSRGD